MDAGSFDAEDGLPTKTPTEIDGQPCHEENTNTTEISVSELFVACTAPNATNFARCDVMWINWDRTPQHIFFRRMAGQHQKRTP